MRLPPGAGADHDLALIEECFSGVRTVRQNAQNRRLRPHAAIRRLHTGAVNSGAGGAESLNPGRSFTIHTIPIARARLAINAVT